MFHHHHHHRSESFVGGFELCSSFYTKNPLLYVSHYSEIFVSTGYDPSHNSNTPHPTSPHHQRSNSTVYPTSSSNASNSTHPSRPSTPSPCLNPIFPHPPCVPLPSSRALVERLVAEPLIDYLVQNGVLSAPQGAGVRAERSTARQNLLLLGHVEAAGHTGRQLLVNALRMSGQHRLASALDVSVGAGPARHINGLTSKTRRNGEVSIHIQVTAMKLDENTRNSFGDLLQSDWVMLEEFSNSASHVSHQRLFRQSSDIPQRAQKYQQRQLQPIHHDRHFKQRQLKSKLQQNSQYHHCQLGQYEIYQCQPPEYQNQQQTERENPMFLVNKSEKSEGNLQSEKQSNKSWTSSFMERLRSTEMCVLRCFTKILPQNGKNRSQQGLSSVTKGGPIDMERSSTTTFEDSAKLDSKNRSSSQFEDKKTKASKPQPSILERSLMLNMSSVVNNRPLSRDSIRFASSAAMTSYNENSLSQRQRGKKFMQPALVTSSIPARKLDLETENRKPEMVSSGGESLQGLADVIRAKIESFYEMLADETHPKRQSLVKYFEQKRGMLVYDIFSSQSSGNDKLLDLRNCSVTIVCICSTLRQLETLKMDLSSGGLCKEFEEIVCSVDVLDGAEKRGVCLKVDANCEKIDLAEAELRKS